MGSNLGERFDHLRNGVEGLRSLALDGAVTISPIYETEPWGRGDQGAFLNAVAGLWIDLEPVSLLVRLKMIEVAEGREPNQELWGARELDIDILAYGDKMIATPEVTIPHPLALLRRFVLTPWGDIAPKWVIAGNGLTVVEALAQCPDEGWVKPYKEQW